MNGIGATDELSLRVSVATLLRVVFTVKGHESMLALERKATFLERERSVIVKAQPFGGAVRINDLETLNRITGGFHFDSERSRAERDFRIFIRPSAWDAVKVFCLDQFQASNDSVLETSPTRELAEELQDSLGVQIDPGHYVYKPLWTVVENDPSPTTNIHIEGQSTVRVYRVFEAQIVDAALSRQIKVNGESFSDEGLRAAALKDLSESGIGRANACMTVSMETLRRFFLSLSPNERSSMIAFEGTLVETNVMALMDGIPTPQYQYVNR